MNVVVMIQGREAIPIRAIPFLTDGQSMSPDALGYVLAGGKLSDSDYELTAHHVLDGDLLSLTKDWWENTALPGFAALKDVINSVQVSEAAGYQQWLEKSSETLPAGAFIWKDDFVSWYEQRTKMLIFARVAERQPLIPSTMGVPDHSIHQALSLNFSPFIPNADQQQMIMAGFESNDDATPSVQAPAHTDFTLVATRQQLVNVYGRFTGMDMTWFSNLKDTPKLKAARKFIGQGGRGHIAEPLFCPYEVMQWLIDPKRKKGRSLTETKAWQLLRVNFPKVYEQYVIGDPND